MNLTEVTEVSRLLHAPIDRKFYRRFTEGGKTGGHYVSTFFQDTAVADHTSER